MPKHDNPSLIVVKVIDPCIVFLVGTLGISMQGIWIVSISDRTTGKSRSTPINVLIYQGARHLVSLHGETEWVQNLRSSGKAEARRGRTRQKFLVAEEVPDDRKPAILRAYLQRWDVQVKRQLKLDSTATDAEFAAIAADVPIFRLIPTV